MADITPEDVAKGMFEHLSKQADSVLLSRKAFIEMGIDVIKETEEKDREHMPDALIGMLIFMERMKLLRELEHKIFGEALELKERNDE